MPANSGQGPPLQKPLSRRERGPVGVSGNHGINLHGRLPLLGERAGVRGWFSRRSWPLAWARRPGPSNTRALA